MSRKVIFFIFIFFIFGCTFNISDEKKINDFIKTIDPRFDIANFNTIVVVNENDGCLSCINLFTNEYLGLKTQKKTLFIISASGSKIDISPFIEEENLLNNIIWDSNMEFKNLGVLEKSGLIYLNNGRITKKEKNKFTN